MNTLLLGLCIAAGVLNVNVTKLSISLYETKDFYIETFCLTPADNTPAKILNNKYLIIGKKACGIDKIIKK